jgi:hypothetical protein
MPEAATSPHLFTPGNTGRMRRQLGFQFQYKGTVDGEIQGFWAKEGSSVRVKRVKKGRRLLWQITIVGKADWTFTHPDEDEILDTLEFFSDSSQAQRLATSDPLAS